jgi:hypothetical protein
MPRVIFDTNVLFSALRSQLGVSYRLLSMVGQVSAPLIAEYEAVLKRGQLTLSDTQVDDVIDYICAQSEHHRIFTYGAPSLKTRMTTLFLSSPSNPKATSSHGTWATLKKVRHWASTL